MKPTYISINTTLFEAAEANIAVTDLSIQRGYAIFDFLKTIGGKPIFVEDHFDRFYHSAKEMHLKIRYSRTELLDAVYALMQSNHMPNSGIKLILTGGYAADGYSLGQPNLIITQSPFEVDQNSFEKGMHLVSYNHQRQLAGIKTIDYLQAIRLQPYIKEKGADDVLYHQDGFVRECPRANFFIVTENQIITPKTAILKGITRGKLLGMTIAGYEVVAEDFTLADLAHAKEAFISSSTKNVWPVLRIDGQTIGDGKAGEISKQLAMKLDELVKRA